MSGSVNTRITATVKVYRCASRIVVTNRRGDGTYSAISVERDGNLGKDAALADVLSVHEEVRTEHDVEQLLRTLCGDDAREPLSQGIGVVGFMRFVRGYYLLVRACRSGGGAPNYIGREERGSALSAGLSPRTHALRPNHHRS